MTAVTPEPAVPRPRAAGAVQPPVHAGPPTAPTPHPMIAATTLGGPAAAPAPRLVQSRDRGTVAVILFQNSPLFESSIPLTVFGVDRRGQGLPYYRLLACMGEAGPLPTTGGILMATPYGLAAADAAGTIIVPAWRAPAERPPEPALATLRRAAKEGARVVGLDLGVFVLAAAGLLDDRSATTHWMYAPTLSRRHPRIRVQPRELCVDTGQFITGAGAAAGFDACLHIVRRDHGPQSAASLARRLVFPIGRRGGQAPYFDAELPEELLGDPIAEAMAWALDHLTEPFDVDAMAERASLSRRSFDRRFRSATGSAPLQWLNAQRVMYAQRMLESTDLPMDQVALRSGFGSLVAMRGHFRRHLSTSPTAYRQTFRGTMTDPDPDPVPAPDPTPSPLTATTPTSAPVPNTDPDPDPDNKAPEDSPLDYSR